MFNEIKQEIIYVFILFFITAWGMMFCDIYNLDAMHKQAEHEAMFICYDFEISTNFEDAMVWEPKYKPKHRVKIYTKAN